MMMDERLETLQKLERRYAFLSSFTTAVSNFSVQYNFQSIAIALLVMSSSVCTDGSDNCRNGHQSSWVTTTASAVVFIGAILGQISMGYLGDLIGRNLALVFTLSIVVCGSFVSAVPVGSSTTIYTVIIIARFFLGIGVGGVYPLSASKAAEEGSKSGSSDEVNVQAAAWSFFWQTPGAMGPWLFALLLLTSNTNEDQEWRLILGMGSVPAFIVLLVTIYSMQVKQRILQLTNENHGKVHMVTTGGLLDTNNNVVNNPMAQPYASHQTSFSVNSSLDTSGGGTKRKYTPSIWYLLKTRPILYRHLLATGGGWFIYDIAFYGVSLFGGEILDAINGGSSKDDDPNSNVSSRPNLTTVCGQQLIGLSLGIPACIVGIYSLSYFSNKFLQVLGFFLIFIAFVLLAATFDILSSESTSALFFFYCILIFTLNYGPNVSTFILPAQTYPKQVRATFNGISAAAGKLGAFLGVYLFGAIIAADDSYPLIMGLCAGISLVGVLISQWAIREEELGKDTLFIDDNERLLAEIDQEQQVTRSLLNPEYVVA